MKYDYLSYDEQKSLQNWHQWLNDNRGDRARLRRADSPEDILLTDAFFNFLQKMPESWRGRKSMLTSAVVAGALSRVKMDKQMPSKINQKKGGKGEVKIASFAEQLATPLEGKSKPAMSELRFQQLQKSQTTDDFYRCIIRAIRQLDCSVNILALTNDIIHWHQEFSKQIDREPSKRLAVRWATDYFTVLLKEKKEN